MARDEDECLQCFDCDDLVAIAIDYFVFIKHLLSTYYVPANGPGMEGEDEIHQLQGDQNLVRKNRQVHN